MPTISYIFPTFGRSGKPFRVFGTGFTGATAVTVGGVSSAFTVESDTRILVTNPTATGAVAVTQGTTATGPTFTVTRWPSDAEINAAIRALIAEVDPTARLIAYRALMFTPELGENARILQTADGDVRAWIVFSEEVRAATPGDASEVRTRTPSAMPQRADVTLVYSIWGFYGFEAGNEFHNSNAAIRDTTLRLLDKFRSAPDLRLTEGRGDDGANIRNHTQLSGDFPRIRFGSREIEVARLRLEVRFFVN